MSKIVVNDYSEFGITEIDLERIKGYAKDQGITKATISKDSNGYITLRNVECSDGSKFQEWRNKRRFDIEDDSHLSSVGRDTQEGSES